MISRAQLQSISDRDAYRTYASLATGCSAAPVPEQMGIRSQPLADATPEITSTNMVNAMHQQESLLLQGFGDVTNSAEMQALLQRELSCCRPLRLLLSFVI